MMAMQVAHKSRIPHPHQVGRSTIGRLVGKKDDFDERLRRYTRCGGQIDILAEFRSTSMLAAVGLETLEGELVTNN